MEWRRSHEHFMWTNKLEQVTHLDSRLTILISLKTTEEYAMKGSTLQMASGAFACSSSQRCSSYRVDDCSNAGVADRGGSKGFYASTSVGRLLLFTEQCFDALSERRTSWVPMHRQCGYVLTQDLPRIPSAQFFPTVNPRRAGTEHWSFGFFHQFVLYQFVENFFVLSRRIYENAQTYTSPQKPIFQNEQAYIFTLFSAHRQNLLYFCSTCLNVFGASPVL